MPYKRVGNKILRKHGGKWELKQECASVQNAKEALRLLYAKESGARVTR